MTCSLQGIGTVYFNQIRLFEVIRVTSPRKVFKYQCGLTTLKTDVARLANSGFDDFMNY